MTPEERLSSALHAREQQIREALDAQDAFVRATAKPRRRAVSWATPLAAAAGLFLVVGAVALWHQGGEEGGPSVVEAGGQSTPAEVADTTAAEPVATSTSAPATATEVPATSVPSDTATEAPATATEVPATAVPSASPAEASGAPLELVTGFVTAGSPAISPVTPWFSATFDRLDLDSGVSFTAVTVSGLTCQPIDTNASANTLCYFIGIRDPNGALIGGTITRTLQADVIDFVVYYGPIDLNFETGMATLTAGIQLPVAPEALDRCRGFNFPTTDGLGISIPELQITEFSTCQTPQ